MAKASKPITLREWQAILACYLERMRQPGKIGKDVEKTGDCSQSRAHVRRKKAPKPMPFTGRVGRVRSTSAAKELQSPTSILWLIARLYCTGTPEDYAAVHEIQDELKLVPLSSSDKPYSPPPGHVDPSIDMKTPVRDQVNNMDAVAYFTRALHRPNSRFDAATVPPEASFWVLGREGRGSVRQTGLCRSA